MPQITGISDIFSTIQYTGELFSADSSNTPLLSLIGELNGGLQTENEEFSTAVIYDYPAAKQPAISETDAITAPTANFLTKSQETNVVQIFQETIEMTYSRMATSKRLTPIEATTSLESLAETELDWQVLQKLRIVARDVEHTFLNGNFQKRTNPITANKSRGLIDLCSVNQKNAGGAALSKVMLKELYKEMADNGAYFSNSIIFVNSIQKEALSEIYAGQTGFCLPESRTTGGVNITEIDNDFFKCGVVYDRFMPKDVLLIADVAHIVPVFQTIPNKGNLFVEQLAKTGASERFQLYGHIGLAHGPSFLHAVIKDLQI